MDAELRERFQAELPQIRDWLDDFTEDELQVAPEFECSILQAERDPVVGLGGRVHIWKPVSLWANVDGGGFDANSESAFELQRQRRTIAKASISSEDWSYQIQAALNFNSPGGMDPARLRYLKCNFVSAGFTNKTALNGPFVQGG